MAVIKKQNKLVTALFEKGIKGGLFYVSVALHRVAGVLLGLIILIITYDVVARHFFNSPLIWSLEISTTMYVFIIFGGLGYATFRRRHIRMTFLVEKLAPPVQKWLVLVTGIIGVIVAVVFAWQTYEFFLRSLETGRVVEGSVMRLPAYIPQLIIPVGFALFSLQLAIQAFERFKEIQR